MRRQKPAEIHPNPLRPKDESLGFFGCREDLPLCSPKFKVSVNLLLTLLLFLPDIPLPSPPPLPPSLLPTTPTAGSCTVFAALSPDLVIPKVRIPQRTPGSLCPEPTLRLLAIKPPSNPFLMQISRFSYPHLKTSSPPRPPCPSSPTSPRASAPSSSSRSLSSPSAKKFPAPPSSPGVSPPMAPSSSAPPTASSPQLCSGSLATAASRNMPPRAVSSGSCATPPA